MSRRRSSVQEAHDIYLKYHKHSLDYDFGHDEHERDTTTLTQKSSPNKELPKEPPSFERTFHHVEKTGVIYATSRASAYGFAAEDPEWANMGQGAPETGPLPGAPSRSFRLDIPDAELEYAPVSGLTELRVKVAEYYNHLYRQGHASKYSYENICVVPGGRAGITRIMAALGQTQVGYFIPDYTAYEQALGLFLRVSPIPLLHRNVNEAVMSAEEFDFNVTGAGLGAMLLSNPANPTGQSIEGDQLKSYVSLARDRNCAIIMDEFYSHYYYDGPQKEQDPVNGGADDDSNWPKTVSSAVYIDDVDADPILIVNGLTKNWRCPGFRVCWIVAPKKIVSMLGSAGSFLDGGANAPLQRLALPLMDLDFIRRDTWALQRHFRVKRDFLLHELPKLGISVDFHPTATFYIWGSLLNLPPPLNDSLVFLEECVKHKVVVVPGVFFNLSPRSLRTNLHVSSCNSHVRFSYGPPMENLVKGVAHMKTMIESWKLHPESVEEYAHEELLE